MVHTRCAQPRAGARNTKESKTESVCVGNPHGKEKAAECACDCRLRRMLCKELSVILGLDPHHVFLSLFVIFPRLYGSKAAQQGHPGQGKNPALSVLTGMRRGVRVYSPSPRFLHRENGGGVAYLPFLLGQTERRVKGCRGPSTTTNVRLSESPLCGDSQPQVSRGCLSPG